ncbi:MAG: transcriptional regulator, TetR family [Solirubrobacterales bacterium]|nr:transcriptional regulator, TetR family [Solirubrobacterales bacterium]
MAVVSRPTRERLLDAAAEGFYRNGIAATPIDAVAERAGILKGSVYYHFHSKRALVDAYLERERTRWSQWMAGLAAPSLDPRAQLLAVIDGYADRLAEEDFRGDPFLNAAVELPHDAGVGAHAQRHARELHRLLASRSAAAGAPDPSVLARVLASLLYGAIAAVQLGDRRGARAACSAAQLAVVEQCPVTLRVAS